MIIKKMKNFMDIKLTSSGNSFLMGFNFSVEPTFEMAPLMAENISRVNPTSSQYLLQLIGNPSWAASRRYSETVCSLIGADLPGKFYDRKNRKL
jgi:hypothetical protein